MLLPLILVVLVGYLLGSLPFGYLVARARGVNIFEVGSRNPGATNVRRVLGAGPGNTVFVLDALKGAGAASWALLHSFGAKVTLDLSLWGLSTDAVLEGERWTQLGVAGLVAALLGHGFSCFTRFRGGKGVATSVGGLVILMPLAAVIAAAVWVAVFYSSRYVSLASILAALSLVAAAWLLSLPALLLGLTVLIAAFVVIRHRSNIGRLLNGTENKSVKKGAAQKS
jgi:glycerol-3-phosphate acyltransferase PlsY